LIESAREAAAAEIAKQEEDLRKRLEEEFPTPTAIPPTPTQAPTDTATPSPTPTSTPVPPTATPPPTVTPIPPTPTPSVREGEIVTPGAGVIVPAVIFREQPVYPSRAQAMQVEGVVEAEALVGIDGGVEEVRILSSSRKGVGFEAATEEAVMKWRFKPATKKGVKVRMWVAIRVPYRLR
jgi:TonB family protein